MANPVQESSQILPISTQQSARTNENSFLAAAKKTAGFAVGVLGDLSLLIPAGALSLYGKCVKSNFDPSSDKIKRDKTPILMIHGNGFNEMQWLLPRQFLKGDDFGSVFTLNLDGLVSNEHDNGIEEVYAQKVQEKLAEIRKLTGRDDIILIGHSMGGLVAAECEAREPDHVKKVITISTPFESPPLLEFLGKTTGKFMPSAFKTPVRYQEMRNENGYVTNLKKRIHKEKYFAIYSTADEMVPGKSGGLDLPPSQRLEYHWLGHYTPMVSPTLWLKVQKIIRGREAEES